MTENRRQMADPGKQMTEERRAMNQVKSN